MDIMVPQKMIIWFGRDVIQWDKSNFYLALRAPFKRFKAEDFNTDTLSISIEQADMVRNFTREAKYGPTLGIHMPYVVGRMEKRKSDKLKELRKNGIDDFFIDEEYEYTSAEQFILQIPDIEVVMQMNIGQFYDWRS
jgi:hypothetical protein